MLLNEVHISSLVIHVNPTFLMQVKAAIETFENAEIYAQSDDGKLVVVLETENQGFITDTIDAISQLPHVLSTALVYHYIDTDDTDQVDAVNFTTEQPNLCQNEGQL
jgi:periplasmic nitrate reductase NapD